MSQAHNISAEELVRILGSAASYNDKGYAWSGHDKTQQEHFRAALQEEIIILANALGPDILGPDLYDALVSGKAVKDFSGNFVSLVQIRLGMD